MKKIIISAVFFFAFNIYAASGPNGVSVYLSTGYNPTGMGLTDFMNKPFDANILSSYQSVFPNTLYAPMITMEDNARFQENDSKNTYSTGTAFSSGLKFNFLTFFFLKSDFTYDSNRYLPIVYKGTFKVGSPGEPMEGSEVTYTFSYESMYVPLTLGLNIPVSINNRYKADIYIGAGAVWTSTRYIFSIDAPDGYINDGSITQPAFKEELEFEAMTFGYTWTVGLDYVIAANLKFFMEADSYIYSKIISKTDYTSSTMLTTTVDGPKTEMDLSHTIIKIGVSYEFSGLIKNYFF
ncbi:MAG: hypothetical protein JW982_10500 [Spirochaetes bacterium]|nr:hypothetical protein [Spirochaetota bacterium]